MRAHYFLLGCVTVAADLENATSILNICMFRCIPYVSIDVSDDETVMCFRSNAFIKFKNEADKCGVQYDVIKKSGLPYILDRYRHRYGILFGILLAALLIFLSQQFIWNIDVVGNESITSSKIKAMLNGHGFKVGSLISRVNTDRIENEMLIDSDEISWISINIMGTVAQVQVRENTSADADIHMTRPANIVAKKSGLIEEVRLYRGNAVTVSGKYVEKGELLISGIFDSNTVGFRYTRAAGTVLARTVTEYLVEIPYKYDEKVYTGGEYCDKYLNFFDYSINICENSRNIEAFYDKIETVENYSFYDGTQTPFSLRTVRYLEYETETAYRTRETAEALAYFELDRKLRSVADSSVMLKKEITPIAASDRFILRCTVVSIEDIAEVSEFEVELGKSEN